MKINFTHLIVKLLLIAWFFMAFFWLTGCDVSKKQTKHYKKFIQYGGKVNCKNDTLWKYDTTFVEGKMRIDSIPIPCNCPEVIIGYTNKQLRMLLRAQKDSMNYLLKLEKIRADKLQDSLNGLLKLKKEETKQVQTTEKPEKINAWSNLLWVIVFVLLIIAVIIYLIKRK